MKPVNIYTLSRIEDSGDLRRMERQMSEREHFLNIKAWEMGSLRKLVGHLMKMDPAFADLRFYYSFEIPKLGKEFDLLRISTDTIVNVELKSEPVEEGRIREQLLLNRYYLNSLERDLRSYTYISGEDRLLRLTRSGKLRETSWEELGMDLQKQEAESLYTDDIELLFRAEQFLISPVMEPERFLRGDYFLTSQQRDIEQKILKRIGEEGSECRAKSPCMQGFSGLPGTGKTLLLYDLALKLSQRQKVCFLQFGAWPERLDDLNRRLSRVSFLPGPESVGKSLEEFAYVLVDEAHQMKVSELRSLLAACSVPLIFSYDNEEAISPMEKAEDPVKRICALADYREYRLTNRIRTNSQLSSFIRVMMHPADYAHRKYYPAVTVAYANNLAEAEVLAGIFQKEGYTFLACGKGEEMHGPLQSAAAGASALCCDYDSLWMMVDRSFFYDGDGYLRCQLTETGIGESKGLMAGESRVRLLFRGLNRARHKIAILVLENQDVFRTLLDILQGKDPVRKQRFPVS